VNLIAWRLLWVVRNRQKAETAVVRAIKIRLVGGWDPGGGDFQAADKFGQVCE